jgi:precorrin-6A/cobalt-precorrin-6A reductase
MVETRALQGRRILILGGTREARELAKLLVEQGFEVVTSLAGATREHALYPGLVRTGGFGGVHALLNYLEDEKFDAIADATHPFATRISKNAAGAAAQANKPIVRLERPPWRPEPGDRWRMFPDAAAVAAAVPDGARILLTIGSRGVEDYFLRPHLGGVARMIEPPAVPAPSSWKVLLARPPFRLEDELGLLEREAIDIIVSKNSGGEDMRAKLHAARARYIPVYMIERPHKPDITVKSTPEDTLAHLLDVVRT